MAYRKCESYEWVSALAVAPASPGPRGLRPPRPIHDWFTEGFDTSDLKDAKALLDELK